MRKYVGTITEEEVGIGAFRTPLGRIARSAFGRIMTQDIGKRVYLVDGVAQVENEQQKAERLAYEAL